MDAHEADRLVEEMHALPLEGVLQEALRICEGDRQASYGHPYDNYKVIRAMWSAITGVELTYTQCVFMMMTLKMARELSRHKKDNLVDIAGYAWVLDKVLEKARENGETL